MVTRAAHRLEIPRIFRIGFDLLALLIWSSAVLFQGLGRNGIGPRNRGVQITTPAHPSFLGQTVQFYQPKLQVPAFAPLEVVR